MEILSSFILLAYLFTLDGATGERSKRAIFPGNQFADFVKHSIDVATVELKHKKALEEQFYKQGTDAILKDGYMWHHSRFMAVQDPAKFEQLNNKAYIVLRAVKEFEKVSGMPLAVMKKDPNLLSIWKKLIAPQCQCPKPVCNPTDLYRTPDGTCNNALYTKWGASNTAQLRWLPAAYIDGVNSPRALSVTGEPLPSARLVSNCIHNPGKATFLSSRFTIMFMTWGQFIDHDFSGTPQNKGFNNSNIRCCDLDKKTKDLRGSCFPIAIPEDDPHFNHLCMNFVRSAAAPVDDCLPEWRNPINQHTSFIDASMVYGATADSMKNLRAYHGGYLKMFDHGMMPRTDNHNKCMRETKGDYCFAAGDDRSMVVPSLAYAHTLFVREHNRLAAKLGLLNPHWSDERIFQEARKIVSALMQHITYAEYIPPMLGEHITELYGLSIKSKDHDTRYDPKVDPTASVVFTTAAFRYGHSQVPNQQGVAGADGVIWGVLPIERTFNRPRFMLSEKGRGYDGVGSWVVNDVQSKQDRFLDDGVRNKLFLDKKGKSLDLAALNIQRGRDHGIPSYNAWRIFCGLSPAQHFGDGPGGLVDVQPEAAIKFRKIYGHPDDIDLFPAAMSEKTLPGALVGPTFACLLGKQFRNFRVGDRFWYENEFKNIGFSKAQLRQIKRVTMSSVMCVNTQIRSIQYSAFWVPSEKNPRLPCELHPQIDLRFWSEAGHTNTYVPELYDVRNLSRVPLNPVPFWMASAYNSMLSFPDIYHKHVASISRRKVY